jgi:hypothetical protein
LYRTNKIEDEEREIAKLRAKLEHEEANSLQQTGIEDTEVDIEKLQTELEAVGDDDDLEDVIPKGRVLTEVIEEDFELEVYSELVNLATEALMLSNWDGLSDHAVRLILFDKFVEGVDEFWYKVQKTIWPKKFPELEASIINLSDRLSVYVRHFLSNSRLRENNITHVEDQTWKLRWGDDDYDEMLEKSKKWQDTSTKLLFNVVVALNEFADSVRKLLNKKYFISQGKFIVNDSLGVLMDWLTRNVPHLGRAKPARLTARK